MNSGLLKTAVFLRNRVPSTILTKNIFTSKRCCSAPPAKPPLAKEKRSVNEPDDRPIQFLGSKAAAWNAKDGRSGGSEEMLWYQPYVVIGSVTVFMIYFCVLREESDIDKKLEGKLFDHITGLEEAQLIFSYRYNRENGLEVKAIEQRLAELGIDVKSLN